MARVKLKDAQFVLVKDHFNLQLHDNVKSARETYISLLSAEESFF